MIQINLIAEKKKQTRSRATPALKVDGGGNSGQQVLLAGILLVCIAIAGGWWYTLDGKVKDWRDKHQAADAEIERLQGVLKKADRYEREKELLSQKIDLVTNLKKQQAVPVQILDAVSRNLPSFLWLESMSSTNSSISLSGKAMNFQAVSYFYNNLNDAGVFSGVELGRTYEVPEGVAFSLKCRFAGSVAAAANADEADAG